MVSCGWVNDDYTDCPTGTWLHFSYTYNILDVDAAYNQVDDISIFIFDDNGRYIKTQEVDSLQFQQNSAMVEIDQPQGEYKILVWGGLSDSNYALSNLIEGETLYEDVELSLSKSAEADENSALLSFLFHCRLDYIAVTDYYNIIEAPLVKNSNHFSVIIQDESNNDLQVGDLGIVIRSDNGVLGYDNNIIEGNYINYTPYSQFLTEVTNTSLDGEVVVSSICASYINTLRLFVGDDTSLSIVNTSNDERLVDISIVQYLLLTQSYYGFGNISNQEYLDRQDSYSLIFYLEKCSDSTEGYICTKVSVNGWIVRFNDTELIKQ
ncbi:MAG: FimB/Mfa2 family fimbrial subunit [Rikenellaceae bacterium]